MRHPELILLHSASADGFDVRPVTFTSRWLFPKEVQIRPRRQTPCPAEEVREPHVGDAVRDGIEQSRRRDEDRQVPSGSTDATGHVAPMPAKGRDFTDARRDCGLPGLVDLVPPVFLQIAPRRLCPFLWCGFAIAAPAPATKALH